MLSVTLPLSHRCVLVWWCTQHGDKRRAASVRWLLHTADRRVTTTVASALHTWRLFTARSRPRTRPTAPLEVTSVAIAVAAAAVAHASPKREPHALQVAGCGNVFVAPVSSPRVPSAGQTARARLSTAACGVVLVQPSAAAAGVSGPKAGSPVSAVSVGDLEAFLAPGGGVAPALHASKQARTCGPLQSMCGGRVVCAVVWCVRKYRWLSGGCVVVVGCSCASCVVAVWWLCASCVGGV